MLGPITQGTMKGEINKHFEFDVFRPTMSQNGCMPKLEAKNAMGQKQNMQFNAIDYQASPPSELKEFIPKDF